MKRTALAFLFVSTLATQAFQIVTVPEQIPESNPVTRTVVSEGRTRFSFIIPPTWISSVDSASRKIHFESPVPHATISIRMLTNALPASAPEFKAQAVKNLQNPEVMEEFRAFSGGGRGLGIDVKHQVNGGFAMMSRVNWYPAPEGVIEVSMSVIPDEFSKMHAPWTGFINSFRVEKEQERRAPR